MTSRITGFFKRMFARKPVQHVPKPSFRVQFNARSWRSSPEYVKQAADLLATPLMRDVLGVLFAEIPGGYPMRGQAITDTQAAIELGRVSGYQDCLALMLSLGQPLPQVENIEEDWGAEAIMRRYDLSGK